MNRLTRLLAVAGMGIGAAIALAGPAQAATSDSASKATAQTKAHWGDDDRVVGYFDDPFTCNRVGRIGEMRDRWDDYDCNRVRFGFHRGDWELSVSERDFGGPFRFHGDGPRFHNNGFNNGFHGGIRGGMNHNPLFFHHHKK
jgi:hypothetical protein